MEDKRNMVNKEEVLGEVVAEEITFDDVAVMEEAVQPAGGVCGVGCPASGVACGLACK